MTLSEQEIVNHWGQANDVLRYYLWHRNGVPAAELVTKCRGMTDAFGCEESFLAMFCWMVDARAMRRA